MILISPQKISSAKDLEKAFLKWSDLIYGYIFLRVHCHETAEDLAQDVFFKAFRSRETFDAKKSNLKTWLFTIAKNTLTDHFKNSKIQTSNIDDFIDKLADEKSNTETQTDAKNLTELISNKMELLNERDREILILRFKQDLSIKEIAKIFDMEYSATKVAAHRSLKRLTELCNDVVF